MSLLVLSACAIGFKACAESTPVTIRLPLKHDKSADSHVPDDQTQTVLPPVDLNLQAGERLSYDIHVNGLAAGKANLVVKKREETEKGPSAWVIEMDTRSNRAVSLFYAVDDTARCYIDVKGSFSRQYHVALKEGDIKSEEKIAFKYDIGDMQAQYERPRYVDGDIQWRMHTIPLTDKVLDPLAAIYYLRGVDFTELLTDKKARESYIVLPICTDRHVWNTKVRVTEHGTEDFGGKLGMRKFIKIVPEAEFRGLFERKGKMFIWLDAETRIPLKMDVEVPIGHAEVLLSQYENSPLRDGDKQ